MMVLLVGFGGKVGFQDQDRSVVGDCGLHEETHDNGLRLTGLASILNMVILNATFPQQEDTCSKLDIPRMRHK